MPLALFPIPANLPPIVTTQPKPLDASPEEAEGFADLVETEQDRNRETEEEADFLPFVIPQPLPDRPNSVGAASVTKGQLTPLSVGATKPLPPSAELPDPPPTDVLTVTVTEDAETPAPRSPASHESAFLLRLAEEQKGNATSPRPDVTSDLSGEAPMMIGAASAGSGLLAGQDGRSATHSGASDVQKNTGECEAGAMGDDPGLAPAVAGPAGTSDQAGTSASSLTALPGPSVDGQVLRTALPEAALRPAPPPQQIAQAILTAPAPGQVALTLAPAELGQLRFGLRRHGERLHVTLSAERPETLDLLRRNLPDLAQELKAAGYDGASFDFEGWQGNPGSARNPASKGQPLETREADRPEPRLEPASRPALPSGQLDLRV